ncbi:hypothetical protein B0H15DRAFT_84403 [Mycena belliarum]|uniref:phytol kinase n=1 Tax=Mycena belliarum TaxID=1033014 RepID=A0AAD6XEB4_9AGAR|nr:hypothetical protein B0H15DRAFT_84403 [Mycena belliae]
MHPAVHIRNLERLPFSIKRVALTACKTRSIDNLKRARDLMDDVPAPQRLLFLPVYFTNLNPTHVPTTTELALLSPLTRLRITCAVIALDGLFYIREPPMAVGPTVWPGLWAWVNFMHTHWEQLPSVQMLSKYTLYAEFVRFVGFFHDHPQTYALMEATVGFRHVLGTVLALVPHAALQENPYLEVVLNDLFGFLIHCGVSQPAQLAEILDGIGGTIDDAAHLVVDCLDFVVQRTEMIANANVYYIRALLHFVLDSDNIPCETDGADIKKLGTLSRALLLQGFIPALVHAMQFLTTTSSADETGLALSNGFTILRRIFTTFNSRICLECALDAGLLSVIVACATLECTIDLTRDLRHLLTRILPGALVQYFVVFCLQKISDEIEEASEADDFVRSSLFKCFSDFWMLAKKRMSILDRLESSEYVALKACDNSECNKILPRSALERCAACKASYYCGRSCQTRDWRLGGHKKACPGPCIISLTESATGGNMNHHERDFLRAVVDDDYRLQRSTIYLQQTKVMAATPGPVLTIFDYTRMPPKVMVQSVAESSMARGLDRMTAEWASALGRVSATVGRLQLHVVLLNEGDGPRCWIVPLRANSGSLQLAVEALATKKLSDDALKILIEETLDAEEEAGLLEIH